MINFADRICKERKIQLTEDMHERPPTDWEDCIEVGFVVPLFKKGERISSSRSIN